MGTLSKADQKRQKFILGLNFIELLLKNRMEQLKQVQGHLKISLLSLIALDTA